MNEHTVRDFRRAFDAADLLGMVPIDPARLMLARLRTRDIDGDAYEVLEYLVASADWHNRNGLHCEGACLRISDIAVAQDLPFERALTAFAQLRDTGIVSICPPSARFPKGSYWIDLMRLEPLTAATLEANRQRERATYMPRSADPQ